MEGATELKVTGLTPFFSYTFSVTAENSVSSHDTDTAVRTTSVSITTLEGGIYMCNYEVERQRHKKNKSTTPRAALLFSRKNFFLSKEKQELCGIRTTLQYRQVLYQLNHNGNSAGRG